MLAALVYLPPLDICQRNLDDILPVRNSAVFVIGIGCTCTKMSWGKEKRIRLTYKTEIEKTTICCVDPRFSTDCWKLDDARRGYFPNLFRRLEVK